MCNLILILIFYFSSTRMNIYFDKRKNKTVFYVFLMSEEYFTILLKIKAFCIVKE